MNYSAASPANSLLRTPVTQPAYLDAQSFMSTLTISPQLRLWRHDAIVQHHDTTAAYIGEKVLALTSDPNDAFWLAQAYYNARYYARAHNVLLQRNLTGISVACRYLAAQCLVAMQRWQDALQLLGEENPFRVRNMFQDQPLTIKDSDGGIRLEASMCHLRGLIYANLNNLDKAKKAYQEALQVDIKCYDAFDQLITNSLMTPDEEWAFLDSLDFSSLDDENQSFIKMLYGLRVSKYNTRAGPLIADTETKLLAAGLKENADVLLAKADLLFTQCRFPECLTTTTRILELDAYKFNAMPLHLTCLHELGFKNDLFLLSHDMVERHPEEPVSWLAVGIYYMSIGKIAEARRYFSKASVMNPRFGSAWIGFAHSFAIEGEHDQAISAYTTAARLFQGTHLPSLFLGMQHLHLNNFVLADEYLGTAYKMCQTDPLLLNELGVLVPAIEWFKRTIEVAAETGGKDKTWVATHANLGHAYRKLRYVTSRLAPHDAAPYSACGLMFMHLGQLDEAISNLHEALALSPSEPLATDLLTKALEEAASQAFLPHGMDDHQVDSEVDHLLMQTRQPSQAVADRRHEQHQQWRGEGNRGDTQAGSDEEDMSYSD
ncbi:anaphase control protein cut9 [Protomyces lactucae-debilis]|uniref:Anaphase control protein cut9 n=1 Tax=Protomyces lactucae-debilis TaxID=2754530 RepID=A0A1Y2ETE5_PROLT|nr:anaphase control protein cut9 [Protomyces lactucae-debilis]ORY74829.1 anaphase control protein cut9 [Protomyces lactucae-debilis]